LTVEIAMTAVTTVEDPDNPTQALELYAPVATAREMEAVLDLLEERAVEALTVADSAASLLLRREVVRRAPEIHSRRFVDAESHVKAGGAADRADRRAERRRSARRARRGRRRSRPPWETYANIRTCPIRAHGLRGDARARRRARVQMLNDILREDPVEMLNGVDATYAPQQELTRTRPDPAGPDRQPSRPLRRIDIPTERRRCASM
jgi:hypothetical protein